MLTTDFQYLNHDLAEHRLLLAEKSWDREKALIIFDELHKMHEWKSWLKGIYDVEGIPPGLMVTGSAGLDAFRKVGDSLAGGHFQIRLHPIDLKEALAYLQAKSEATPCPPMPLKTESKKIGRGIEGHERARRWSHGGPKSTSENWQRLLDPNASLERAGIYIRSKPSISSHSSVNPVGVLDTLESMANTRSYFLLTLASFLR